MIKVDVVVDHYLWNKKVKKPQIFFNKILKKFPKKYRFLNKKINLSLSLSNNSKIKKLNLKFRNKNKHTDVLSFPFFEKENVKNFLRKKNSYIGDIIISYEHIFSKKNSQNQQILINTFVHGFLHLLGFDHIKLQDFKKMNKEEKKIINSIKS